MSIRLIFIFVFLNYLSSHAQSQLEIFTKDNVLTSNQITCYLVDSKGLVWIGTESGLNAYSSGKWYPISAISNDKTGKDEQLGRVAKIYEDSKQNIWAGTNNGLFTYSNGSWVHFLQDEEENMIAIDILEDRAGRIWFGLENIKKFEDFYNLQVTMVSGIVYMFNYESWYSIGQTTGNVALRYNIPPKFFTAFLQDKAGNIWIASLEGLYRFYGDKIVEIESDELQRIKIFDAISDSKGEIWAATELGVFRYVNNTWTQYRKRDGLSADFFYNIVEDPSGRIWAFSAIDMKFNGLSMFDGDNWQQFDDDAIHLKGSVGELLWWEDQVFAFSKNGVSRYDSSGWHRFDRKEGLTDKNYSFIVRNRFNEIYLAGKNGLYQFDTEKWLKLYEPADDWTVTKIFTDKKRHLWIATASSGVFHYSNNSWKQLNEENGLPDNEVSDIFDDKKDNIWFVTKKGLAKAIMSE